MEEERKNLRTRQKNSDNTSLKDPPLSDFYAHNNYPGSSSNSPNSDIPNQPDVLGYPQYKSANEYSQAVRQWLWHYQWCSQMNWFYATFPFYAMSCMPGPHLQYPQPTSSSGLGSQNRTPHQQFGSVRPIHPPANQRNQEQGTNNQERRGHEYKLPGIWTRVLAEFIDFLLLFIIKMGVTILAVEYVGFIDLHKYDLETLLTKDLDYETAVAMTSELVTLEIVNRVFICLFETMCLRRGLAGTTGGATPGKRMLGLLVVSCDEVVLLPGNKVRVIPAQDIGFWNALVRSVIKNFSLAFLFPVCLTVIFSPHKRAAYDVFASCIVVQTTDGHLWARGRQFR